MAAAEARDDDLDDHKLEGVLTDDDLESEIELVSVLVLAASSSVGPLSQSEVDRLLGVDLREHGPAAGSER
jgi:hypothetical protein